MRIVKPLPPIPIDLNQLSDYLKRGEAISISRMREALEYLIEERQELRKENAKLEGASNNRKD